MGWWPGFAFADLQIESTPLVELSLVWEVLDYMLESVGSCLQLTTLECLERLFVEPDGPAIGLASGLRSGVLACRQHLDTARLFLFLCGGASARRSGDLGASCPLPCWGLFGHGFVYVRRERFKYPFWRPASWLP